MTIRAALARILIAALLLLGALSVDVAANLDDIPASGNLYISANDLHQRFVPLDPVTLADQPAGSAIDFGEVYPTWAVSADGSTIVRIDYKGPGTISVRDARTGAERIRFEPGIYAVAPQLSADGSRLVVQIQQSGTPSGVSRPAWYTFDTATGELLSIVEGDGQGIDPLDFHDGLIDADARRLYLPFVADAADGSGPWPLRIVAHDLTTGAEVGRIELPDVLAGSWWSETDDQGLTNGVLTPAVALSPDGRHLAIVSADSSTLILLDTDRLAVARTVAVSQPRDLLDRLFGLLPLAPQTAEAKFLAGLVLRAVFAPDGRHLYLFGYEGDVNEENEITGDGLGLRVIDVEDGTIQAESLAGMEVQDLLVAPDDRSLYAGTLAEPLMIARTPQPYVLYRLDASSLEPLAERTFGGHPRLLLLDAPPATQATAIVA